MRCLWFFLLVIISHTSNAQSGQFCFALAETFYGQVYCQLQAKAQVKDLPSFHQFIKNSEHVQYSLLKRPAERNAIKLPKPKAALVSRGNTLSASPERGLETSQTRQPASKVTNAMVKTLEGNGEDCALQGKIITCNNQKFLLTGNKANHRLVKDALSPDNHMALPQYSGTQLTQYLEAAYMQYIHKMDEIGLGGVTMTYGKFAYLYQDLLNKGLNFPQRFETMFTFLKKDKAKLGVSESVSLPDGFSVNNCAPLGARYRVCDHHGRNYIFAAQ